MTSIDDGTVKRSIAVQEVAMVMLTIHCEFKGHCQSGSPYGAGAEVEPKAGLVERDREKVVLHKTAGAAADRPAYVARVHRREH